MIRLRATAEDPPAQPRQMMRREQAQRRVGDDRSGGVGQGLLAVGLGQQRAGATVAAEGSMGEQRRRRWWWW